VRVTCARYSPDGERIAYVVDGQLYMLDAPGAPLLAADWCSWSPDGTKLVLERGGDLWTYDVASGGLVQLTSTPVPENDPDWSPDGDKIAYCLNDAPPGKLMVYSFSSGEHMEIYRGQFGPEVRAPDWNPGGTRIVLDLAGFVGPGRGTKDWGVENQHRYAVIVDYPGGSSSPVPCYCSGAYSGRWHSGGEWLLVAAEYNNDYAVYAVHVPSGGTVEVRYNGNFAIPTVDWRPSGAEWLLSSVPSVGGYLEICPAPAVSVTSATWGSVKALFRR
jgi:Tol biopolymer transport system component